MPDAALLKKSISVGVVNAFVVDGQGGNRRVLCLMPMI